MNLGYLGLGVVLLTVTVVDQLWTTLWVDGGAGPLSSRLTTWTWRGLRRVSGSRSRLLSISGPLVLVLTLGVWIGLLWAGWTFLFAGGHHALIDTREPERVTWMGRIYFVAYTLFTMGNGDFTPADGVWQVATGLTTASGMLFVTLSVSYLLSVLRAVARKRSFASTVTGIGTESEAFVQTAWNDDAENFEDLDLPLDTISTQLDQLVEQHEAYPVLHYYHPERARHASAVGVAILDEALTTLQHGVPAEYRPNETLMESTRASACDYLGTLSSAFVEPADRTPPPPDLDPIRDCGVPTVSDEEFAERVDELADRRRKLLGMLRNDAWEWPPSAND